MFEGCAGDQDLAGGGKTTRELIEHPGLAAQVEKAIEEDMSPGNA